MRKLIGFVLVIVGVVLFFQGLNRKNSLVGEASSAGTSIANSVDGGTRTPQHVMLMIGGGVLAVVGAGMALRKSSSS